MTARRLFLAAVLAPTLLALGASPVSGEITCDGGTLVAEDPRSGDQLGCSVFVRGEVLVLGANLDDTAAPDAGAVTPFRRVNGQWVREPELTAFDARPGDQLGFSASIDGTWLAVGAPFADSDRAADAGAVYLFRRQDDRWVAGPKLTAADASRGDRFGQSLSLRGGTLLIGAPFDDAAGSLSGSVYVFELSEGSWVQRQKLTAGDGRPFDNFGFSVSLDGGAAVVGAPFRDGGRGKGSSGAAYVFERDGTVWIQRALLTAGDAEADDQLGSSVAVSGGTVVVGARGDDRRSDRDTGSVYVFEGRGEAWNQAAHLFGEAPGDLFGGAVSLSGDRLLIGARLHDHSGASDSGLTYLYTRRSPDGALGWTLVDRLPGAAFSHGDEFGQAVSIDGDTLLAGAYLDDGGATNAGSGTVCETGPPPPVVTIEKTNDVPGVSPGETITYQITVTHRSGPAAQVQVTDTFRRAFLQGISWCPGPDLGCANPRSTNINETIFLQPRAQAFFTVRARVAPDASGELVNKACALPAGGKRACDEERDRISEIPFVVLQVVKSGPAQVAVGGEITYSVTVRNVGTATATGVVLEDRPRTHGALRPLSASPSGCTLDGDGFSCDLPDIPAGGSRTASFTFEALDSCENEIVNEARVTSDETSARSATRTTLLTRPAPILEIEKTGPDSAQPGEIVEYTLRVTNNGPTRACGVTVEDPVPAGLSSPSAPAPCTLGLNRIVCPAGDLPPDETFEAEVSFTVIPEACGLEIHNTASVTAGGAGLLSATKVTEIGCDDLAIVKTHSPATVSPGQALFYMITVSNLGPDSVSGARVTDTFPPELTNVLWCRDADGNAPCAPNKPGDLDDLPPSLPAGGSATYRVQATVSPLFTGKLVNTASVAGPPGFQDTNTGNDSAMDMVEVAGDGMSIFCLDIDGPFVEGGVITYTFLLRNDGPVDQMDNPGDEFVDVLPPGLTFVSAAADSGTVGPGATWNGAIPAGGTVTITVTATIDAGTLGLAICNQATFFFDADGNGTNESSVLSDACCFTVLPDNGEIPTLSDAALVLLILLLALAALRRLRM